MKKVSHIAMRSLTCLLVVLLMISSLSLNASAASVGNNLDDILFDADYYYNKYPDLCSIGRNSTALRQHYLQYGKKEGRSPSSLFDPKFYIENYWDLKEAFGDNWAKAYDHFIRYGIKEGRQGSALFNVQTYKNNYADLRNAFGTDTSNNWKYLKHWREYGSAEKRNATTAISSSQNYEKAWFPAPVMNLTQIAYESYSHSGCNVIDIAPGGRVFAPFTGKIVYKNERWGYVLFQSLDKVQFANGTVDYLTMGLMHDSNISDLKIGQVIRQGQEFYDAGGMGAGNPNAYATHCEIGLFRGQISSPPNPSKLCNGNVYAYDALFINTAKTTSIVNKGKMVSGNRMTNGAPSNWSNLWKNC